MPTRPEDFYSMLGLPRSATPDEIRRAYLLAAKRLHPDTNVGPGETELFLDVQQAYQVLSDPARRSAYDATLPPEKEAPVIVNKRVLLSRKELSPNKENQLVYMLLDLFPADKYKMESNSAALNICIVLDCSTSMKGPKLDMVKATAIQLIRKLKPQDIFSVVTFSDRAEVVIPATRQANPLKMENRIQLLQTSGGTEILHGLQAGFEEVRRYQNPAYINHIILLTDGRTYGDEPACYALAKDAAQNGIGISGMGIGSSWNDVFLDELARLTGGQSMLVSQPNDIERLLTEKFTNLSNTFADNVTLEFNLEDGVEISYAFRIQPETNPILQENPLPLGPILKDWPLSVLIEFIVRPQTRAIENLTVINGKLNISGIVEEMPIPNIPIKISLPMRETSTPEAPPAPIIQALSKLTLYRMQEKARKEVAAGNFEDAAQHLQKLATHLLAQGERSLAKTILFEVENIEKEQAFTEHGEKQIKYGTRALVLPRENKS
jgi:Ca-activated chloride channel family protein